MPPYPVRVDATGDAEVDAVLAGRGSYDSLTTAQQRIVRDRWGQRTTELLAALDLPAQFRAAGHSWVELDDGNVVRRT